MPQGNKDKINESKKLIALRKAEADALKAVYQATGKTAEEMEKLNNAYKVAEQATKDYHKNLKKAVKGADDWNDRMIDMTKNMQKGIGQGKDFDRFIGRMGKVVLKSKNNLVALAEETKNAAKEFGVGSTQFKKLDSLSKDTENILKLTQDKTKFEAANMDAMIKQAEAAAVQLDKTEGISKAAKRRAKDNIKILKTMKAQQQVMKKMTKSASMFTDAIDGAKEAFAQIKANPVMAITLMAMGALEKAVSAVNAEANKLNDTLGIGLVDSMGEATKQMSAMPASSFMETIGLAPQVASRAREAANQAALAAGNLDLMHDTTIGINDATAALDYGIQTSQVSELADSLDVATNLTRQEASAAINAAAAFAKANKVAPKAVLEDMANNAGVLAKYSDGTAEGMARAAVQAAKLGIELATVGTMMDGLLDLETSIASEFEASVLLGKDLNLDKARTLALNNDIEGAMNEIVKQIGTEADFQAMNAIQRQALADSVGVNVEDLSQMMAKGGKKLEEDYPKAQLKTLEDLQKAAAIRDNLLGKIVAMLGGLLSFLMTGGLLGKLWKGLKNKLGMGKQPRSKTGLTKSGKPDMRTKKGRDLAKKAAKKAARGPSKISRASKYLKSTRVGKAASTGMKGVRGMAGGGAGVIAKGLGRVALPLAAALDGLHLFSEFTKKDATTKSKSEATGSVAGGWAAAAGGAKLGAAIGAFGGPIGVAIGGVLGGAAGYFIGSKLGKAVGGGAADIAAKIGPKVSATWDSISASTSAFASSAKEKISGWASSAKEKFTSFASNAKDKFQAFKDKAGPVLSGLKDKFVTFAKKGGLVGIAMSKSKEALLSLGKAASTKVKAGLDKASQAFTAFKESGGLKGWFSRVAQGAKDIVLGSRESGGPITKSGTYMVGEAGPELVNLSRGSNVVPNDKIQGGLAKGAGSDDLIGAINALRIELRSINTNTKRGADAAERTKIGASV